MNKYTVKVNGVDMTNFCYSIEPIEEQKSIENNVIKPEYELTFFWRDWLIPEKSNSPFANIDIREFKIEFIETLIDDIVFEGNIKSINPKNDKINVVVGFSGDDILDRKVTTAYFDYNPVEIIKLLCDEFGLVINETYYMYAKSSYQNVKGSVIPDENSTVLEIFQDIAEKFALQIYFSKNQIYVDIKNPELQDNIALELTDHDILDVNFAKNNLEQDFYTNYVFKCEDEGDIQLSDENGFNLGKSIRQEYGDIPYDEQDGSVGQVVRIKDALSGHYALINFIKYYGRLFYENELKLDLRTFNGFRLDTIFVWNSEKYNFKKRFGIEKITRDTEKRMIKLKACELVEEENKTFFSGYGYNYGGNYGN